MHKGYFFAKVRETRRKNTLHITSVIDLLYFHSMHFQVMSLTATEFHHKYKKNLILQKSRIVLKARDVSFKSQEHFCVCLDMPQQNSRALCRSQITSQKS